jgi:hypothetical protein
MSSAPSWHLVTTMTSLPVACYHSRNALRLLGLESLQGIARATAARTCNGGESGMSTSAAAATLAAKALARQATSRAGAT